MALRISSWIIGLGCLMAAAGLCFLPAAFGVHRDMAVFTAGAMVFSTGMVLAAAGFLYQGAILGGGGPVETERECEGKTKGLQSVWHPGVGSGVPRPQREPLSRMPRQTLRL